MASAATVSEINRAALPLDFDADFDGNHAPYGQLLDWIGDRSVVLIGEASHGTHDFYRERGQITRLLIEQKGFNAVAVEGDWPDAHRVHHFVTGSGDANAGNVGVDSDAREALGDF